MKKKWATYIWVTDDDGKRYICNAQDVYKDTQSLESLSEEDQSTCKNVNGGFDRHSLENLNYLKLDKW